MVNLWAVAQVAPQHFFPWKDSLLRLTVSPDERFIAAACQDSAVHLWYLGTGEDLHMGGYPSKIRSMDWSHDSQYFATASGQMIVVWNCAGGGPEGREPKVIPVHQKSVCAISFDHASHRLANAGQDGLVLVYDVARDEPIAGLFSEEPVTALAWSHSDQRIAVGDESGCLQVCLLPQ
jgi:WD40 repeat protein